MAAEDRLAAEYGVSVTPTVAPAKKSKANKYSVPAALADMIVTYWTPVPDRQLFRRQPGGEEDPLVPGDPGEPTSVLDALDDFYDLDEEQLAALQMSLARYGWYDGKGDPSVPSYADTKFFDAWKKVVTTAARSGKSIDQILTSGKAKPAGAAREPLVTVVSNPADIKEAARRKAAEVLGRSVDDKWLDQFAKVYQGMQAAPQADKYGKALTGGSVTQAPSVDVAAEERLRSDFAAEAGATDVAGVFGDFLDIVQRGIRG